MQMYCEIYHKGPYNVWVGPGRILLKVLSFNSSEGTWMYRITINMLCCTMQNMDYQMCIDIRLKEITPLLPYGKGLFPT